ncbi:MAG: class IV adenylate cyclase [Candidatus Saccharimonadales bacterium]
MREIEIKARVLDRASLLDVLTSKSIDLSDPITQHDEVYGEPGINGGDENSAAWLRIRTETKNGNTVQILTLKKSVTNQMDSIEHETIIGNSDEMKKIIHHLGYEPYSDITKTRQKAMIGGIEICVDEVAPLGVFIEAEKLTEEDADYEIVARELWELLESFGITKDSHVTDGYDVLMRRHDGLQG